MPGGIEKSKQFWAIQAAKPKTDNWNTLQIHTAGDIAALTYASELDSKLPHNIRVVPSDKQGTPMGQPIAHPIPSSKPSAKKSAAPKSSSEISSLESSLSELSAKPKKSK
jgi:hypothetical protein